MTTPRDIFKDCPFPEVAESLRPYIKTRQDATRIRQGLHSTFPLSPLHTAADVAALNVKPSTLTGVRKAYWQAYEAHQAALAKYDSLKAELDQLIHRDPSSGQNEEINDDSSALFTENYIPLLRQKEKLRKLTIIDKTTAKIAIVGGNSLTDSFDKIAKRQIGELPAPPSASTFSERDPGSVPEFDLTDLKRAMLSTKQKIDEHETAISDMTVNTDESTPIDPRADLLGLQTAHNELTTWMETQLALISDIGSGPKAPDPTTTNGDLPHNEPNGHGNSTDPIPDIETLYEHYLDARERLISTIAHPPSTTQPVDLEDLDAEGQHRRTPGDGHDASDQPRLTPSEILLPYISRLVAIKDTEQARLQQGAYTRRRVAAAETQLQAILGRLADESHLIEPSHTRSAPTGKAWDAAATKAADATYQHAMQRIQAGQAAADVASSTLESIRDLPETLKSFLK